MVMSGRPSNLITLFLGRLSLVCCLVIRGSTGDFLLLRYFSCIVSHPGFSGLHNTFLSSPYL